jgi:murein DD-endopeptidase MepM/ murein hydrolase activator NlpD
MKKKHSISISLLLTMAIFLFILASCSPVDEQPVYDDSFEPYATPVAHSFTNPELIELESLFLQVVQENSDDLMFEQSYAIIDEVEFSDDRSLAMVWFALVDKTSNTIQPGEPGLALAVKNVPAEGEAGVWHVILKNDPGWYETLQRFPESMINYELELFTMPNEQKDAHNAQVFTGYRLPWPAGKAVRVSGSIGHVYLYKSCPNTCRFAYDFADGTMFPVVAAKGGRVKYAVWQYPNGNTKHANYLVLEDTTTTPTTYQVYYHLAQDSIPVALRVPGTMVVQGQYIGNADDTGYSTGHHLHFHVHTRPDAVWGPSVDIVFDDVDINGGRPRTAYEAKTFPKLGTGYHTGNWFVSENGDREVPTGTISSPKAMERISTRYLTVKGSGKDDYGVAFLQLLATYDGNWFPIGPLMKSTPFETTLDLCEAGIPNGPFFLSLQVIDTAGKTSEGFQGLVKLEKRYTCPQETSECVPAANQAGVYSSSAYGGACMVLDYGKHPLSEVNTLLKDGIQSIKIGNQALVYLHASAGFDGEKVALLTSEDHLADINLPFNSIQGVEIVEKPDQPQVPIIQQPRNSRDLSPTVEDEVLIIWNEDPAVALYTWEISGPNGYLFQSEPQKAHSFNAGYLAQGEYLFLLKAENVIGSSQSSIRFTVRPIDEASQSELSPLPEITASTAIFLQWQVSGGSDDLDHFEIQVRINGSDWQNWERPLTAQMRQAWYLGEPGKHYEFRIRAIDAAGNLEDLPLTAEASTIIEEACLADEYESQESSSALVQASMMEIGQSQIHSICPSGDEDWITFPLNNGETVEIVSTPLSGAAATILQVYRSDRYTKIMEVFPSALESPTKLEWISDLDGIYYLRVIPLDQKIYGTDSRYEIKLNRIGEKPAPNFMLPALALPFLWFLMKIVSSIRIRKNED